MAGAIGGSEGRTDSGVVIIGTSGGKASSRRGDDDGHTIPFIKSSISARLGIPVDVAPGISEQGIL